MFQKAHWQDLSQKTSLLPRTNKVFLQACHFLKSAVDSSSFILTILTGLESEILNLASRTEITIHIIGADWEEIRRGSMTEELYHLLPNLERLVVGYVRH